jgi:hypothetical protein
MLQAAKVVSVTACQFLMVLSFFWSLHFPLFPILQPGY